MVNWTRRRLQSTRSTCSDVSVTSCNTCWRCYGDIVVTLVLWRHVVNETETTNELDDVWMMMDGYKQQLLLMELQGKYRCYQILQFVRKKETTMFLSYLP